MQALLLFISGFPAVCFQSKVTDKISGSHNVPHFQTASAGKTISAASQKKYARNGKGRRLSISQSIYRIH